MGNLNKRKFKLLGAGLLLAGGLLSTTAMADEMTEGYSTFTGPYVGVGVGREQVTAGADANGIDVLAHETKTVASVFAGLRWQLGNGFVIGGELGVGLFDGDLHLDVPAENASFDYEGGRQFRYGGQVGYAFGEEREWLVFGYLNETRRKFDVTITHNGMTFDQNDEQGVLRYGIGVERMIQDHVSVRAMVGSGRSDFSGPTYNEPDTEIEFELGLVYQF